MVEKSSVSVREEERAVSPVIGVILMVAITVILAAVIGAFVLEIGDQQETAPSTSFDSEQFNKFYIDKNAQDGCGAADGGECTTNLTTIEVSHAGGDTLSLGNVGMQVGGDDLAMKFTSSDYNSGYFFAYSQPNHLRTLGTNQPPAFTSGETWQFASHGDPEAEFHNPEDFDKGQNGGNCKDLRGPNNNAVLAVVYNSPNPDGGEANMGPRSGYGACGGANGKPFGELEQGENVNVVWEASSGGKTQTIFKYTVQ